MVGNKRGPLDDLHRPFCPPPYHRPKIRTRDREAEPTRVTEMSLRQCPPSHWHHDNARRRAENADPENLGSPVSATVSTTRCRCGNQLTIARNIAMISRASTKRGTPSSMAAMVIVSAFESVSRPVVISRAIVRAEGTRWRFSASDHGVWL
jgi:hypothetical protein